MRTFAAALVSVVLFAACGGGDQPTNGTVVEAGASGAAASDSLKRRLEVAAVTANGVFTPSAEMTDQRAGHTATRLLDGRVLVVGGIGQLLSAQNTAEIYDPALGVFVPAGNMAVTRYGHSATLLPNGKVLIAGGFHAFASEANDSAETYDPATNTFSPTGNLVVGRYFHMATALADGRVLIAGGEGFSVAVLNAAEIYDPATGQFSATGDMHFRRGNGGTATLLGDGTVLIAGGTGTDALFQNPVGALATTELFHPTTGGFELGADMTAPRWGHVAARLGDGTVLLAGGANLPVGETVEVPLSSAEIFDPNTRGFTATPPMQNPRKLLSATLLSTGQVLLAGGADDNLAGDGSPSSTAAELYDAPARNFFTTDAMNVPRSQHTATLLSDGQVLITGGDDNGPVRTTELIAFLPQVPEASDGSLSVNEDTTTSGALAATNPGVTPLNFSIVTNGVRGTATITNAATGAFTYTPNLNVSGADVFTFKASNSSGDSNVATVSVTINAVNDAPVATSGSTSTLVGVPVSGTLLATDVDNANLVFSIVGNGTKGTVLLTNSATGAYTYTPNAGASGPDSFTFKAGDLSADSNIATVTVTITAQAPVAQGTTLAVVEDTGARGILVANDPGGAALTYSIVSNGAKGSATITNTATGAFRYAPDRDAVGTDTFTFKASNGIVDSNIAVVSVTIAPVNDAPVAKDATYVIAIGAHLFGTLVATDVDGDVLTYAIQATPVRATLRLLDPSTGAFRFTPDIGVRGTYSFRFTATDPSGRSGSGRVKIVVNRCGC